MNSAVSEIKVVIETLVRALVDKPDTVVVDVNDSASRTVIYTIKMDRSEIGKVIGKEGRNANALRTLINAVAMKLDLRVVIDIDQGP